jgi:hypothetical protein
MIRVEITSEQVTEREGVSGELSKNPGKPFKTRKQTAYLHRDGQTYPDRFEISLGDLKPYKPGHYALAPQSYKVGKFGDLEIDRFNLLLLPLPASMAKAG